MDEEITDRMHAERILKKNGVEVTAKPPGELLMQAARLAKLNIVKFFTETVSPSYKNKFEDTPLHYAAMGGDSETIRHLLNWGNDPLALNLYGETALFYAAEEGHTQALEVLASYGGLQIQDKFGETPLHFAAREGHLNACVLLLEKAPELLNVLNEEEKTPLSYALSQGHIDLARHLESLGGRIKT